MELFKYILKKPDGREWIEYRDHPYPQDFSYENVGLLRPPEWEAPHKRWNKMRREWVAVSASRQERPFLPPKEYCPLCPQKQAEFPTEIPKCSTPYQWAVFENMYPGLSLENVTGRCEVILYSAVHDACVSQLQLKQIRGLVRVWQDRSEQLAKLDRIEQVFIFENRGKEIGVTLHHPHGQIYAFDHVPAFIASELAAALAHYEETQECLVCSLRDYEISAAARVVFEADTIVAYIPEGARYPYEVHITSKNHRTVVEDLLPQEVADLALTLKAVTCALDQLFHSPMPYVMVHHQAPCQERGSKSYHWHIEFYPAKRNATKLKYLAGVESGAGMFINDTLAEEKARELRELICDMSL